MRATLILGSLLLLAALVTAQVPNQICYQGNLTTSTGTPVNGPINITFRFYNTASGPTPSGPLWSSGLQSVTCANGTFTVYLGAPPMPAIVPALVSDSNLYLGITVGDDPDGPELTPRARLVTQPYAYRAATANTAGQASTVSSGGVTSSAIADGTIQFGDLGQNGASSGQVIKWNGSAWAAANDAIGAGTYLPLTGGTLTGSLTISHGNLDLDTSTATFGVITKFGYPFIHNYGLDNFFAGLNAGNMVLTGYENTGVGREVLFNLNTGHYNTAVGARALRANTGGDANTACGGGALEKNSIGLYNTATGYLALRENTNGEGNCAFGRGALQNNTTADHNSAFGHLALSQNSTGTDNTAVGVSALGANNAGGSNTAVGASALPINRTGTQNTAVGSQALYQTRNSYNTACGSASLASNRSGTMNTALGAWADVTDTNFTNATAIGYEAQVNASNKIRLGNSSVTVIEGQVAYTFTSDRNSKENFLPVDGNAVLSNIRQMNLTSWNYRGNDPIRFRHYGPTAQDFFAAFGHDEIGQCGDSVTINSGDQAGILFIAVQALIKDRDKLVAENLDLRARLEKLENMLSRLDPK